MFFWTRISEIIFHAESAEWEGIFWTQIAQIKQILRRLFDSFRPEQSDSGVATFLSAVLSFLSLLPLFFILRCKPTTPKKKMTIPWKKLLPRHTETPVLPNRSHFFSPQRTIKGGVLQGLVSEVRLPPVFKKMKGKCNIFFNHSLLWTKRLLLLPPKSACLTAVWHTGSAPSPFASALPALSALRTWITFIICENYPLTPSLVYGDRRVLPPFVVCPLSPRLPLRRVRKCCSWNQRITFIN